MGWYVFLLRLNNKMKVRQGFWVLFCTKGKKINNHPLLALSMQNEKFIAVFCILQTSQ